MTLKYMDGDGKVTDVDLNAVVKLRRALSHEELQSQLLIRALQQIIDHPQMKAVAVRIEIAREAIARYHANRREEDQVNI